MRILAALLIPFAVCVAPCGAQTTPNPGPSGMRITPDDRVALELIEHGAEGIDIAADKRADLGGCGGADSAGLAHAIRSCWPVLQSYRTFAPLQAAVARWEGLPRNDQTLDTPESREVVKFADAVIADARPRAYPAQDPPLMIAYLTKGLVAIAQDDLPGFVAHYSSARDVAATSPIKAHWFTRDIARLDDQIAQAKEMIDQLAWLKAAKAAAGEK